MNTSEKQLQERVLDNDYPVYWDYIYVADGKVVRSDIQGTVSDLKRDLKAEVITTCDYFGRGLEKINY